MPVEWSPAAHARPTEWLQRVTESQPPYAVIRRFLLGDPNRPEEWFRVVTWSPTSEARELIGWVRTFDAACAVGWDHYCAFESWRSHMAPQRTDSSAMNQLKPAASELVKFWRKQQAATDAARRTSGSQRARTPR